jgi:hypothetical protein
MYAEQVTSFLRDNFVLMAMKKKDSPAGRQCVVSASSIRIVGDRDRERKYIIDLFKLTIYRVLAGFGY